MEYKSFHGGYFLEHIINGGVWVVLFETATKLPTNGTMFKVVTKTKEWVDL